MERISSSVMPGRVVDPDRRVLRMPAARARRGKSSSRSMPLRSFCASMRASDVSIRCTSDSLLISSEKNATGTLLLDRRVLRDVERERRLSHRRTRRDDDEVRRLEARRHLVEIAEAARDAGDRLAAALERLDALHRRPEQLLDAR